MTFSSHDTPISRSRPKSRESRDTGRIIFWAVALFMAALLVFQAWHLYPMAETDSLWFLPPAVNYAKHLGLINNLYPWAYYYDPAGGYHFAFYSPGFPWLLGLLAPEASARGVYVVLGAFCALTVLLTSLFLDRVIRERSSLSPNASWGLGVLGLLALGTYESSYNLGRPDFLATLLILIGWATVMRGKSFRWAWAGFFLGLIAFVHPVAALFSSVLLGLGLAWTLPFRTVLRKVVLAYLLGLVVLALLFVVSPNGWHNYVSGISHHAENTLVHDTWGDPYKDRLPKYLIWQSYATGYGFLFLLGVALGIRAFCNRPERPRSGFGSALFASILAVFIFHFVAQSWDRSYNLWLFTPLLLLALFRFGFDYLNVLSAPSSRSLLLAVVVAVMGMASLGFVHRTLLFTLYLHEQETAVVAHQKIAELLADRTKGAIGVSKSLWVLLDDYDRPQGFTLHPEDLGHPRYVLLQQRFTNFPEAPELPCYRLIYDDFDPDEPRFLGIPLSPTQPSYRFAFYESTEPERLLWR